MKYMAIEIIVKIKKINKYFIYEFYTLIHELLYYNLYFNYIDISRNNRG